MLAIASEVERTAARSRATPIIAAWSTGGAGSSLPAGSAAMILHLGRRDPHSMTTDPRRLPDWKNGWTATVQIEGAWTLVGRVA